MKENTWHFISFLTLIYFLYFNLIFEQFMYTHDQTLIKVHKMLDTADE